MSDLFRKEVVDTRIRRLAGKVILATPVSARLLGLFLILVVLASVVFASLASYARRETVPGWVTPDRGLIRAVAAQGGRIDALAVKEGDHVADGAALATLRVSSDIEGGDAGTLLAAGLNAEAAANRRSAEASAAQLASEAQQLQQHRGNILAARTQVEQQVSMQQDRIRIAQADADRAAALAAQGFFPRRDLEAKQGAVLAAQQELAALNQQKLTLEAELIDTNTRLGAMPIQAMASSAASQVTQAQIAERQADAQSHSEYVVRTAVAGRVAALPARLGQVLQPGGAVAAIIPEGSRLEAELYAPSRAIGFIRVGQQVRLMYQAFPYQRFGAGVGVVASVSRTVLAPNEVAIPGLSVSEPVFRIEVQLNRDYVQAYGQRTPLQPGMLLTADVIIDQRSLLEWLLDPLYAVGRR